MKAFFKPVSQVICQQNASVLANHLANKYAREYKTTGRRKHSMFLIGFYLWVFAAIITFIYVSILNVTGTLTIDAVVILMFVIAPLIIAGIVLMIVGPCIKRRVKRTTVRVKYTDSKEMQNRVSVLLGRKGYKIIDEHGEKVWKCGVGFWTAMKYIKIEFVENNTMLVSGWIRTIGGNEQDLSGAFVCVVPKKQVLDVLTEIQSFAY